MCMYVSTQLNVLIWCEYIYLLFCMNVELGVLE